MNEAITKYLPRFLMIISPIILGWLIEDLLFVLIAYVLIIIVLLYRIVDNQEKIK